MPDIIRPFLAIKGGPTFESIYNAAGLDPAAAVTFYGHPGQEGSFRVEGFEWIDEERSRLNVSLVCAEDNFAGKEGMPVKLTNYDLKSFTGTLRIR